MKNLNAIKDRYLKEPSERRLGHLASDLARISTFLENSVNMKAVEDILEESKFFIEWVAPDVSYPVQVLLSEIQSKLALWQLHLLQQKENVTEIKQLKAMTKKWSEHLVNISGFLTA